MLSSGGLSSPALLDEEGNFTGFDVVIGNPPCVTASRACLVWIRM